MLEVEGGGVVVVVILNLSEGGYWGLNEEDQEGEGEDEDEVGRLA